MAELAHLGFVVDSSQPVKAASDLDKLSGSAKTAEASASSLAGAFKKSAEQQVQSAQAFKLNNQQLMGMQYQLNDIAVMLASGQSPFVLLMQQGMQIGQMFGPGVGINAALKATGAGILSFLTNPINLGVVAVASLAGGISLLWDAFSGPEAQSAEDILAGVNEQLDQLKINYPQAAEEAKKYMEAATSSDILLAGFQRSEAELRLGIGQAIEDIADKSRELGVVMKDDLSPGATAVREIHALGDQLRNGEITAQDFAQAVSEIALAENLPDSVRDFAAELVKSTDDARTLEAALSAVEQAAANIGKTRIELGMDYLAAQLTKQQEEMTGFGAGNVGDNFDLRSSWISQQEKAAREAERAFRDMQREAEKAERAAIQYAEQRASNQTFIDDLQEEVRVLGLSTEERERGLIVLNEERAVRAAIARLGKTATQEEIAAIRELVPQRLALLEANKEQQDAIRKEIALYQDMGSEIGGALRSVMDGSKSAEEAVLDLALAFAEAALKAQILQMFGEGSPEGSFWTALVGSIFGGARAEGGPVDAGKAYIVGEKRPEVFVPDRSGYIVPSVGQMAANNNSPSHTFAPNISINVSGSAPGVEKAIRREVDDALKAYNDQSYDRFLANHNAALKQDFNYRNG